MHVDVSFEPHWGFFLEGSFLEIVKLKNPNEIVSSLSNVITFLEKI